MAEQPVVFKYENGVGHLTLNRPDARNTLSENMLAALQKTLETINATSDLRVVIIDANGPGFCAGHDLKEMNRHRGDDDGGRAYFESLFGACSQFMAGLVASPKIFIASVNGIATAAGCQMVAACDMAVASHNARFGVNGINSGLFCSTPMVSLSRNAGRKAAMELLTTGKLMSAEQAVVANIINEAVRKTDLDERVESLAANVAQKPAQVLALGKRAFYQQLELPLEQAYAFTSQVITDNMMMDDAKEGICAFLEKRQPNWD